MDTLLKPLLVREKLLQEGLRIFTPWEFTLLFKTSSVRTKYFLETQSKEGGILYRLKQGIYALRTDPPNEKEIANALYKPSYISYDYALSYYNLIPEAVYQVTSATTKPTRLFATSTLVFGYYTIKTEAYTGYTLKKEEARGFYIAEPEKAVVDYLYALTLGHRGLLGKRAVNDRLDIRNLNSKKILNYGSFFESRKLDEWIGKLLKERTK